MSDQEVKEFLEQRYGDFILYRPPFKSITAWVWVAPFILLVFGVSILIFNLRRRRERVVTQPLSADEQARANNLLREEGESGAPSPSSGPSGHLLPGGEGKQVRPPAAGITAGDRS